LINLAQLHTAAMYSPEAPTRAEADEAWSGFDAIDAALKHSVPRLRRWRTRWFAGIGRWRAARAETRALSDNETNEKNETGGPNEVAPGPSYTR
jgi:hypothetical protein